MQTTDYSSGFSLSGAVIAMAGAQDHALLGLFFEDDGIDEAARTPSVAEVHALAIRALDEARQLLRTALGTGDGDAVADCQALVQEAQSCALQTQQMRKGQPLSGLVARIQAVTAAVHAEAAGMEHGSSKTPAKPLKYYFRPERWRATPVAGIMPRGFALNDDISRFRQHWSAALSDVAAAASGELVAGAAPELASAAHAALHSQAADTLRTASAIAQRVDQAVAAEAAQETPPAPSRSLRQRIAGCWSDLRAVGTRAYRRMMGYFGAEEEEISLEERLLNELPLPTLQASDQRMLQGVIACLTPHGIAGLTDIDPGAPLKPNKIELEILLPMQRPGLP